MKAVMQYSVAGLRLVPSGSAFLLSSLTNSPSADTPEKMQPTSDIPFPMSPVVGKKYSLDELFCITAACIKNHPIHPMLYECLCWGGTVIYSLQMHP